LAGATWSEARAWWRKETASQKEEEKSLNQFQLLFIKK